MVNHELGGFGNTFHNAVPMAFTQPSRLKRRWSGANLPILSSTEPGGGGRSSGLVNAWLKFDTRGCGNMDNRNKFRLVFGGDE